MPSISPKTKCTNLHTLISCFCCAKIPSSSDSNTDSDLYNGDVEIDDTTMPMRILSPRDTAYDPTTSKQKARSMSLKSLKERNTVSKSEQLSSIAESPASLREQRSAGEGASAKANASASSERVFIADLSTFQTPVLLPPQSPLRPIQEIAEPPSARMTMAAPGTLASPSREDALRSHPVPGGDSSGSSEEKYETPLSKMSSGRTGYLHTV